MGFLDIDWRNYDFDRHLCAVKSTLPICTVAMDILCAKDISRVLDQACELRLYADNVVVVPKDPLLADVIDDLIPSDFLLGYSVPTRYGGTSILPEKFTRQVHLLGGRPDVQRKLAEKMNVVSLDCNRFTVDARFGDYFDGVSFKPHPVGGYELCIADSLENINRIWAGYHQF